MGSRLLDEVKADLKGVDDVNNQLYLVQVLLGWVCCHPFTFTVLDLIYIRENIYVWADEKSINGEYGDEKVPDLAKGTLRVNQIPLKLWLGVDDLVLLVCIFVDIINHHLFQV